MILGFGRKEIKLRATGAFEYDDMRVAHPCFGFLTHWTFPDFKQKTFEETYTISIRKEPKYGVNNCCLLTTTEIRRFLEEMGVFCEVPQNITIRKRLDKYFVSFTIKGHKLVHKCALFWIRNIFEYPFNLYVLDAFKMDEDPNLKSLSIRQRLQLIANSNKERLSDDCFFIKNRALGNDAEFKERVWNKARYAMIYINPKAWRVKHLFNEDIIGSEFWFRTYDERLEIYKLNFNEINK